MQKWRKSKKEEQKKIAEERIKILFELAQSSKQPRYLKLLEKIAKKYRIDVLELKKCYCPSCYTFLIPGKNCKIRIKKGKRIIICSCGKEIL